LGSFRNFTMHDRFNGNEENSFADYQIALGLVP
jgi:hypothetical protein